MLAVAQRVLKAIAAGLGAGGTAYWAAFPDGVTAEEWGKAVGAALAVGFATWAVRNKT